MKSNRKQKPQPKTNAERIKDLADLGQLDNHPVYEVRAFKLFAVSDADKETAQDGMFALFEKYGVNVTDAVLLNSALLLQHYHGLTKIVGKCDLTTEEMLSKVKWQ